MTMTINEPTSENIIAYLSKHKSKWCKFSQISTAITRKPNSPKVRNGLIRLRNKGIIEIKQTMDGVIKVNFYRLKPKEHENI
jgi:hypothetical protein